MDIEDLGNKKKKKKKKEDTIKWENIKDLI